MTKAMEPLKDASHLYEVEYSAYHLECPGFRVSELKISPTQSVPGTTTAMYRIPSTS